MATGKCPQCGSRLKIDDPGKTPVFRCPSCGHVCRIGAGEPPGKPSPAPPPGQGSSPPPDTPARPGLVPAPLAEPSIPSAPMAHPSPERAKRPG